MRVPNGFKIDEAAWALVQGLISYWGTTSAAGNAGGTTFVCGDLANEPSYANHAAKILTGPAAGQVRDIDTHPAGTNTVTVSAAFSNVTGAVQQITAGTSFVILSHSPSTAEVAALEAMVTALMADIDTLLSRVAVADIGQTTGTFVFAENNAAEQTLASIAIAARSKVGGIWLDMTNVTEDTTIRIKHKIDGANYRTFTTLSWLTTDDDGVLVGPFTAYRDIQITLQCDGSGAGNVNVPYAVV